MRNIGFFTGSLKKYFITHKKSVKLDFIGFYMISKNIFTNLFSRAWLTLGLRFVLPGRGYSAKLRPYLHLGVLFLELRFLRKLCDRSTANKAALMAIPRPIAQAWAESGFDCLEMRFDGDKLVITPHRS